MPEQQFLPYRVAADSLDLQITSVFLDDRELTLATIIDTDLRTVDLSAHQDWSVLTAHLLVTDPNDELASVLPNGTSITSGIDMHAIVRAIEGRRRSAARLNSEGASRWTGKLVLPRADHHGSVSLLALAVLPESVEVVPGHASKIGERVGWAPTWTLHIDSRAPTPGGAIDSEWVDFANHSSELLRAHADCSWHLDLTDPDRPRLLLNEGTPGLKASLNVTSRTGRAARVRDTLIHSILQPALLQMASVVLSSGVGGYDELDGWRKGLLSALARQVEDGTEEAVADDWLAAWREGEVTQTSAAVSLAIQRHLSFSRGAEMLIKEVGADE